MQQDHRIDAAGNCDHYTIALFQETPFNKGDGERIFQLRHAAKLVKERREAKMIESVNSDSLPRFESVTWNSKQLWINSLKRRKLSAKLSQKQTDNASNPHRDSASSICKSANLRDFKNNDGFACAVREMMQEISSD